DPRRSRPRGGRAPHAHRRVGTPLARDARRRPSQGRRIVRRMAAAAAAFVVLATACSGGGGGRRTRADRTTTSPPETPPTTSVPVGSGPLPGMPPVLDPNDGYAADRPGQLSAEVKDFRSSVYVPNSE